MNTRRTSSAEPRGTWSVWVSPGNTLYLHDGTRWIASFGNPAVRPEQNAANARLMAAAPELLAACEALLECLTNWMEIVDDDDVREYDRVAVRRAERAIRNATATVRRADEESLTSTPPVI